MSLAIAQATSIMTKAVPRNLYYDDNGRWVELPAWASFFIEAGSIAAGSIKPGARLIAGIAVPSRSYAAALSSLGIVITQSVIPVGHVAPAEHFQRICQLEIGSPVSLINDNRKLKGIFTGCTKINGEDWAGIQVENPGHGGLTHRIRARDALKVEISGTGPEILPRRQTGRLVQPLKAFAHHFINKEQAKLYARQSRFDCLILGRLNALRREIEETGFAINTGIDKYDKGTLQDILRVRKLLNENEHYRSDIFRVSGRKPPAVVDGDAPHFIVFDGATSFLRWRDYLRNSHWLVILDRTEPYFRDAARQLDQAYIQNRINDEGLTSIPPAPAGIEMTSFYEPCQ